DRTGRASFLQHAEIVVAHVLGFLIINHPFERQLIFARTEDAAGDGQIYDAAPARLPRAQMIPCPDLLPRRGSDLNPEAFELVLARKSDLQAGEPRRPRDNQFRSFSAAA